MHTTPNSVYEFGEFVLDPRSRTLSHFGKHVNLAAKDLDILIYLVEHAGQFVTIKDLIDNIWKGSETIRYSNITNHISKIRKALNDDANQPTFIKTYHSRKSYRFIAEIRASDGNVDAALLDDRSTCFRITSNLFVPVYCGIATYEKLVAPHKESQWASYKEFTIDGGRLCVLSNGMGVWHLIEHHDFETMSDVAGWRRRYYDRILQRKHPIIHFKQLFDGLTEAEDRIFGEVWQRPSYVFSFLQLDRSPLRNEVQTTKVLEILSSLTPLEEAAVRSDSAHAETHSVQLDSDGQSIAIGLPGEHRGFASWDSVSLQPLSDRAAATSSAIVELEIALQANWWYAKCLNGALLTGEVTKADLRDPISELTRGYARLQTVGATESPALLKITETIIDTSRIAKLANETFRLYDNL